MVTGGEGSEDLRSLIHHLEGASAGPQKERRGQVQTKEAELLIIDFNQTIFFLNPHYMSQGPSKAFAGQAKSTYIHFHPFYPLTSIFIHFHTFLAFSSISNSILLAFQSLIYVYWHKCSNLKKKPRI